MQTDFDAIIIGAGPAGSSAAIRLAGAGWSVALVEKQSFPRRKVCGECIAASNLPLLDALGIGKAFEAVAGPELRQVALMRGERTIIADLPAAEDEKYLWGRALGRETLDTLLVEQASAAGAHVLQPYTVQAIEGGVGNWRCSVRAAEGIATLGLHAGVVIDAHGSWEALTSSRRRSRVTRRRSDLFAFKANFRNMSLAQGVLPILLFDGGYGGMVVADGGMATLACCVRRDHLEACRRVSPGAPGLPIGEAVEAMLQRECGGVRRALKDASRESAWLSVGPLDPGIRVDAGDGLFRIGNAAGEAHPIIGEGMSMALQSSWLLCTQLLAAERREELSAETWQREAGRGYAAQWRHEFEPRLRLAASFAQVAMRPVLSAPLMALARVWPGMLTLGARWGGKVRCAAELTAFDGLALNE